MKPVILIGNGLRNQPEMVAYLCGSGIPVLTTWMACDLLPEDSPVFCGRPGIYGQRAANIIQQKATHLYAFGARLDEQQVAYRYDLFAPNAIKYVYDIDQAEIDKLPSDYISKTDIEIHDRPDPVWLAWCKALYARFRPELDGQDNADYVDPFRFISMLSDYAQPDDIIVAGAGKAGETLMQAFKIKAGQRVQTLSTNGAMGYDIPLSIGACLASGRRVLCVTGDGGFMLNIQELEVIRRLNLPIQFFVHSNNGYGSIRAMQKARFDGHYVGCDPESGFTIPQLTEVAECFGLDYQLIRPKDDFDGFTGNIIELLVNPDYIQIPRVATALIDDKWQQDNMEDMTPKIPDLEELMSWGNGN